MAYPGFKAVMNYNRDIVIVSMYEVNKILNEPCWILKLIRDPHKNYSQVWKVRL